MRVLLSLLVLVAGLLVPMAGTAAAGPDPKIERRLLEAFATTDRADLWVVMKAEADTSKAATAKSRTARGQQVVDALTRTAATSQAPVRGRLRAWGFRSRAFWVTNAIFVRGASLDAARKLARMREVSQIRAPRVYDRPEPVEKKPSSAAPNGLEWGLSNIKADQVWQEFGNAGEEIVVANIDTGVRFDHPALAGQYRGNNGDGTFSHDYNWLDTSGQCTGAPCDKNGHGTHTMGTMAGDDGQGNQIGVAPKVRWIAANGCHTCTDEDLIESAQWMLAPTDVSGNRPDVGKRPHIVNNSWSSKVPSDDPFMEDVQQAWADSGIFGVWSNGNNGPSCKTSGTPGSRILNYSVGNYDIANKIAQRSSRGPGQDGEIKPNIAAPGVNVRSAVPSGYASISGTSMAAPHVAGAIALLWSAQPYLARDIDGTRALLDITAVDTPDDQCGGSAADNNVYGEGRLDALALARTGAAGLGQVDGIVTDARTGQPIKEATVSAAGRDAWTGADGTYRLSLLAGDHEVAVSAFGFERATGTVRVVKAETVTHNVVLTPTPRKTVSGTVKDGSGLGTPLPATVAADDGQGHSWTTESDAQTGRYSLALLPGTNYTISFTAVVAGYSPATRQVSVDSDDVTVDVELTVTLACIAPGYKVTRTGPTQSFDRATRPRRWRVTNTDPGYPGYSYKPGWIFNNPAGRPNDTGGRNRFAIVDSLHYGRRNVQDTKLTSPSIDVSGYRSPALEFANDLEPGVNATATVELSVNGGRTWTTVWRRKGFPGAAGPSAQVVPIPAGTSRTRVRFQYLGQYSGWWAIDDVFIGNRTCDPAGK